jgi:hypothetical protein
MEQVLNIPEPTRFTRHVIHIDSSLVDATRGFTDSSYKVFFKSPLRHVIRADVAYAEIPYMKFNVLSGSNTVQIDEDLTTPASNSFTVHIPPGFYTETELATEFERVLNLQTTAADSTYVVTYLRSQGKFHVSNTAATNLNWFRINTSTMATLMGFTANQVNTTVLAGYDANDTYYQNAAVSDTFVNISTDPSLYLSVAELNQAFFELSYDRSTFPVSDRYFARFSADVGAGSYIYYNNNSGYPMFSEYFPRIERLDMLTIDWIDSNGNPIDFQNVPHTMTLIITCEDRQLDRESRTIRIHHGSQSDGFFREHRL